MASVGITFTKTSLANSHRRDVASREMDLLVDTGALYSVIPSDVLEALAIVALEVETFGLADENTRSYPVGEAYCQLGTKRATSKVVFGPAGVTPLLGALTLESMGLMVNPVTRELLPMRLFLMAIERRRDTQERHACG